MAKKPTKKAIKKKVKKPTKKKIVKPTKKKIVKPTKKKIVKPKKPTKKKVVKPKKIHIVTTPPSVIKVDGVIIGRSPVDFTPEVKKEVEVKRAIPKLKKFKPEPSVYRKTSISPPEGFEVLEVSDDSVSQAKKKISDLLNRICDIIPYACWVRTQSYPKANEADGWLVVSGVKGVDTPSIVSSIQEAMLPDAPPASKEFGLSVLGKGYWISVGFHWQGTGDEEESDQYKKWHGMIEVSSNYRSMSDESIPKARSKILSAFNVGQLPSSRNPNSMITNIEKKFNRTISDIFVKIVWNSKNIKPLRSEAEIEETDE